LGNLRLFIFNKKVFCRGTLKKGEGLKKNIKKVTTTLTTHENPHMDEIRAVHIYRNYRENTQQWSLMSTGSLPEGRTWRHKDYENNRFIGCAGSPWDDHSTNNSCSAILVAETLGVEKNPELIVLLNSTKVVDKKTGPGIGERIPNIINQMNRCGVSHEEVYDWCAVYFDAITAFEKELWNKVSKESKELETFQIRKKFWNSERPWLDLYMQSAKDIIIDVHGKAVFDEWLRKGRKSLSERQRRFDLAKEEIKSKGSVYEIETHKRTLKMVVVDGSDSDQISPASRNLGYDLLIQRNGQGNVQIFANQKNEVSFNGSLLKNLIKRELEMVGGKVAKSSWMFHPSNNGIIMNGSTTASMVQPTSISLEDIVDLVKESLSTKKKGLAKIPVG